MAVIQNLSLANTFGQWVNKTNDIVDTINTLYEYNFTKPTGTMYLNEPTTALVVANNSLFQGLVEIGSSGSIVAHGITEIQKTLYLTNINPDPSGVVLSANGIVSLTGPNHSLQVSNNAVIYGTLNVDNITANTITVKNFNSDYLNAAFSQANTAASFANGAFTKANTTNDLAYIIYAYANTGYNQANNAASFANGAFIKANSAGSFANGAFTLANSEPKGTSAASFANGAFDRANSAYAFANTGYTQSNNAASFANGAFVTANSAASFANSAYTYSNSAYAFANTGYTQANNAASFANGAFVSANSAASFANGAFTLANSEPKGTSAASFANGAFVTSNSAASFANSAYTQANNTASLASIIFDRANSSYAFANTGYTQANNAASFANGAFTKANTTNDLAYIIYAYANTGYNQANSAASFANGAFITANAALPIAGGTLTGDITGANASFQNISASGNFTINGSTVYNSDTFTLNSATVSNQNGTFSNYRPTGLVNAAIRWTESILSWQIRDVNNTNGLTSYANVVTSNLTSSTTRAGIVQLNDTVTSTSTTLAGTANSVRIAYDQANSAYAFANTLAYTSGSFDRANASFDRANSAYAFANTLAYTSGSFDRANSAFAQANNAFNQANVVFNFANTRYSSSGGTISGDVSVTGNLTVNGTTTYIYSKTVDINDSLIHLANNNTSSDTVDIGFYGTYNTGGFARYTGLFRKASDKYYLVQGLTQDPSQNTVTFTSLNRSTLDTNITGGTISSLSSAISVSDGGTGLQTIPAGQIVIGAGTNAITTLANNTPSYGSSNGGYIPIISTDVWGRTTVTGNVAINLSGTTITGSITLTSNVVSNNVISNTVILNNSTTNVPAARMVYNSTAGSIDFVFV